MMMIIVDDDRVDDDETEDGNDYEDYTCCNKHKHVIMLCGCCSHDLISEIHCNYLKVNLILLPRA